MMCSISDAKGVSLPEEKLTGQLNVRNTFLDLEDAETLQERFSNMRKVSSCPALFAQEADEMETVQGSLAQPRQQDSQADTTDHSRTRLSSGAKMFQPRPAATSTTFYATPARPCLQVPPAPSKIMSVPAPTYYASRAQVVLGSPALPSLGSGGHATRECKPCVFFHKKDGCASGRTCLFCHLCDESEKRRRQRQRRRRLA
mmetsp:Transcript_41231/g.96190  ORF Transcript_41231/g.96190 Transcript_41231/m.96190 type:complete len:201 (-) Transcript_41231:53-655(-)|eukprot:s2799_g1.t1